MLAAVILRSAAGQSYQLRADRSSEADQQSTLQIVEYLVSLPFPFASFFSKECYEASIFFCRELSYEGVILTLVYFTSLTLYKAPSDDEFSIRLLALRTGLFSGEV